MSRDREHRFSKLARAEINLIAGWGVEGDAHAGVTVQHRSRVAVDPTQPNLRQVHLIHAELLDGLSASGFDVAPGSLGENVTTRGIDLLGLPRDTILRLGESARVRITGLRNPCAQIDGFQPGLLNEVIGRDGTGAIVRRCGVMGVALAGGIVRPGDRIVAEMPSAPHVALHRV